VAAGRRIVYPWKLEKAQVIQPGEAVCDITPIPIWEPQPISGLAVYVTTIGSAGSLARLGLFRYREDGSFPPAEALVAGTEGTVDTTISGERVHTFAGGTIVLPPGLWFPACAVQGGAAVRATFSAYDSGTLNNALFAWFHGSSMVYAHSNNTTCLTATGVTGALPNPWTATLSQAAAIMVGLVTA
jgi:hypothetical protein